MDLEKEAELEAKFYNKSVSPKRNKYWVWTENNGWERETWKTYYKKVTPKMVKLINQIIKKAHKFNEGHEKTAIPHRPQTVSPMYLAFCGPPPIVCAGCTKFSFQKCNLSKKEINKKIKNSDGGYMDYHMGIYTLDIEQLKKIAAKSDEEVFNSLYKQGGIEA